METIRISLPVWNIEQITGYKPITTFWQDFSIADKFGLDAVKDATTAPALSSYYPDAPPPLYNGTKNKLTS